MWWTTSPEPWLVLRGCGNLISPIADGPHHRRRPAPRAANPPAAGQAAIQAADLMTTDPIHGAPDQLAVAALELMERNRRKAISVMPVQAVGGELVGLLRLHDLVQAGLSRASSPQQMFRRRHEHPVHLDRRALRAGKP